jgi:glycosyltransferase involved in cell wall biosynthesis
LKVLYFTYNGLTEPLGRRQVVPYVVGLAQRGWRFSVVSFEKPETARPEACAEVRARLDEAGVRWIRRTYHRRPSVPATAFDALCGMAAGLLERDPPQIIHARSTVPALMAAVVAGRWRRPWVFDVRGLLAEEYVDGGQWTRGGSLFKLVDRIERRLLHAADGLVFLTDRIDAELRERCVVDRDTPSTVIPCAADLTVFRPSSEDRQRVREELGLGEAPVLLYSGSLGSWYRVEEMICFFAVARREIPGLRFLILTPETEIALRASGGDADVIVRSLRPVEVPAYLAAGDAGICFLGDDASKHASSPTKYAEYLASGLPVVTNRWTGDAASLEGEPAWILIDAFAPEAYARAAGRLRELMMLPAATRDHSRHLAMRKFSLEGAVERYDALYRRVLEMRPRNAAGDNGRRRATGGPV